MHRTCSMTEMKFFNINKKSASNIPAVAVEAINKTPDVDRVPHNCHNMANDNNPNSNDDIIQSYELRLEELGHLMVEQGRNMDEMSSRARRLASENVVLREKLSSGLQLKPRIEPKSPLKSIINQQKRVSVEDYTKLREENSLLHQQAELLVNELTQANNQISKLDLAIGSLERELKANWENAKKSKLTTEKNKLRASLVEKNGEMETLRQELKMQDRLGLQLKSKETQLLIERNDLEKDAAALEMQVKHSSTLMESLQQQLASRDSEVNDLMENNRTLDREIAAANCEARMKQEMIVDLNDSLHREKAERERLTKALKETKDTLADSQVVNETLKSTVEALKANLQTAAEQYKDNLATFAQGQDKLLSSLKQEHSCQQRRLEKAIAELQRVNSSLETERSKLQRDAQCSKQRCIAMEKAIAEKEKMYHGQIKTLSGRAIDAEAQLNASISDQKDLKTKLLLLEDQLRESNDANREMTTMYNKTTEKLRLELLSAKRANESVTLQCQQLQNDLEETKRKCKVEQEKMMKETKQQIELAKLECESLCVARSAEQLKAKEAKILCEKAASLHQSTVEQMKMDENTARLELEKTISDERNVSQRLMSKVQELGQAVQELTLHKHQLNMQKKELADRNNELEHILAQGEMKLRNLARQLTKSVGEQERLATKEAELRMELQKAQYRA